MQQCSSTSCVRTDSRTPRPVRHRAVRLQHTTNKIQRAGRSAAEQQAPGMPPRNTHTHTSCSLRSFISMLLYAPRGSITHSDECIICPVSQVWAHTWPGLASGVVPTHSIPENRNMDYRVMVFSNRSTPCCIVTSCAVTFQSPMSLSLSQVIITSASSVLLPDLCPCVFTRFLLPLVSLPYLYPLCSSQICVLFVNTQRVSLTVAVLPWFASPLSLPNWILFIKHT